MPQTLALQIRSAYDGEKRFTTVFFLHDCAVQRTEVTQDYAQYRDAKTHPGMLDILKYRRTSVSTTFNRKFKPLLACNLENVTHLGADLVSMDYLKCIKTVKNAVVYADPPYAFVHYSRIHHAMETLVKYDDPAIQHKNNTIVKGRYREDRHQSPFCIKTKVRGAFTDMFDGIKASSSDMLLSYSNTGMIDIDVLISLAKEHFGSQYDVWVDVLERTHMTMCHSKDRSRQVEESLINGKGAALDRCRFNQLQFDGRFRPDLCEDSLREFACIAATASNLYDQ